jgi:hypothetical protein
MGKECECVVRFGKEKSKGKALLETNELIFRGDFRLKILFASLRSAKAANGELRLETSEGLAIFELGEQAAKWCEKILHPKTRIEKLGVKNGAHVALVGKFAQEFVDELGGQTKNISDYGLKSKPEWIFLSAEARKDLAQVMKLAKSMPAASGLWIVYPKGRSELTENEVISAGRKAGLKDVKVVGFSATHTGLKFVVPLDKR